MSLKPKKSKTNKPVTKTSPKKKGPSKKVAKEINDALDTLIRHKKHVRDVWLDGKDWASEKSDMAYLVNKSIKRNE